VKIWVDADAAPADVKELVFRAARRLSLSTTLVANAPLSAPKGELISAVQVPGGANVADAYIAEHATAGDVAITADVPLAATLVGKGVFVIDPRGDEYTPENVGSRVAARNLMDELRGAGAIGGGPRPFGPKDKQAFASALDRVLTRAVRAASRG
jgi:uncharacterized protein YaiI (UPF0178 family)